MHSESPLAVKFALLLVLLQSTAVKSSVNLSTFRSLYIRMPEVRLSTHPSRLVYNATTETCARSCVEEVNFECKSFDMDNMHRTCLLFNTSYEEGDAHLEESSLVDHYRSAFEKLFNRLPNHVITVAHKRKVPEMEVEQCARRCVFEMTFRCRGFDYEPQQRNCWLTDLSVETSGAGVKYHKGADFFERILDGPLASFVNYGTGSLPLLDGNQIYNKVMFGLTLGACAQLCLTQTTFECASFDYSFSDSSCHMSEYIAANLNGLNHDVMPTYRIMHYEKKGEYLDYFYPTPYTIVLGHNDKTFQRVSPNQCAKNCLEERDFVCRSFDYQIRNGTCLLSTTAGSDVGSLYHQGQAQAHHFEMKPLLDCGAVLTKQSGSFASPNWPRDYEHNLNCTWHVRVPKFKVISFDFIHFDLGPRHSNPCDRSNDRLIISEMTSHGPVSFCATAPMTSYVSSSNEVTLQFVTTSSVDAPGFSVFYSGDWPCTALLTEDNGQFASPSWPMQYPPLLDCRWTIQAPAHARVSLQFSAIDLDGQGFGRCTKLYDNIQVYDGDSTASQMLRMLCGHDPVTSYTSSDNVLLVRFQTDAHIQRTGFHATYNFIYLSTTTTTTTTSTTTTTARTPGLHDGVYKVTSLTAQFVEPAHDVKRDWGFSSPLPGNTTTRFPIPGGEDGGVYAGPDLSRSNQVSDAFVRTMWALVISLVLLLVILFTILLLVCRHYRKRVPKRRNIPNYTFTEENLSLYEKDT